MHEEGPLLPDVFYEWIEMVNRYPMFDVWRQGRLCSVRLMHLLRPEAGSPWDIFTHWQRLRPHFPPAWLPLGYDSFGNILFWDMEKDAVYMAWKGYRPELSATVASSLKELIENLYYRPFA